MADQLDTWLNELEKVIESPATEEVRLEWGSNNSTEDTNLSSKNSLKNAFEGLQSIIYDLSRYISHRQPAESKKTLSELQDLLEDIKDKAQNEKDCSAEYIMTQFSESVSSKTKLYGDDIEHLPLLSIGNKEETNSAILSSIQSFQELKKTLLLDPDNRLGISQSESKTLDPMEISDEIPVMGKFRTIIGELLEIWHSARELVASKVSKASFPNAEDTILSKRVDLLFWGTEVGDSLTQQDQLKIKLAAARVPPDEKYVLEQFKKGVFVGSSYASFAESLAKQILEKHKLDNSNKLWQAFLALEAEILLLIPKLPHVECATILTRLIGAGIKSKIEKKLLSEVDEIFESLNTHLRNVHQSLDKSSGMEGYICVDADWHVGSQVISLDSAFELRDQFSNRHSEVFNLEATGLNSQFSKSFKKNVILKFWQTRYKPTLLMTMPHIRALEHLLKSSVKTINGSIFSRMQVDFGQDGLRCQTFIHLILFVEQAMKISGTYIRNDPPELLYYAICLDCIQQAFVSECPLPTVEQGLAVYYKVKESLLRILRHVVATKAGKVFSSSFADQNWIHFQKFSRAVKPEASKSIECEGIYSAWMMLSSYARSAVIEYRLRSLPLRLAAEYILGLYLDFFSIVYQTISSMPVSFFRSDMYLNDLKLCINLITSVSDLYSNVSEQTTTNQERRYTVRIWDKPAITCQPINQVFLYRNFQILASCAKNLFITLSHNARTIDQSLNDLSGELYRNRRMLTFYPDILKKALLISASFKIEQDFLKKERHQE